MWESYNKIIHLRYRGYLNLLNAYMYTDNEDHKIASIASVLGYWGELIVKGNEHTKRFRFPDELNVILKDLISIIKTVRAKILSFKWVSTPDFLKTFKNSIIVTFEELGSQSKEIPCHVCRKSIKKLYKITLYGWTSLSSDGFGLFPTSMNADSMINEPASIRESYIRFRNKYETLDASDWFKKEYIVGSECYKYIRHLWTCHICIIETLWEIDSETVTKNLPTSIIDTYSNPNTDREIWMDKTQRWLKEIYECHKNPLKSVEPTSFEYLPYYTDKIHELDTLNGSDSSSESKSADSDSDDSVSVSDTELNMQLATIPKDRTVTPPEVFDISGYAPRVQDLKEKHPKSKTTPKSIVIKNAILYADAQSKGHLFVPTKDFLDLFKYKSGEHNSSDEVLSNMFEYLETLPTPDDINWKIDERFNNLEQFSNIPQLGNIWRQFAVAEVTERICKTDHDRIFTTRLQFQHGINLTPNKKGTLEDFVEMSINTPHTEVIKPNEILNYCKEKGGKEGVRLSIIPVGNYIKIQDAGWGNSLTLKERDLEIKQGKFKLIAVMKYDGDIDLGHYRAFIRTSENGWWECNDDVIRQNRHPNKSSGKNTVLIYQQANIPYCTTIPTGIQNKGTSCFINAACQILFNNVYIQTLIDTWRRVSPGKPLNDTNFRKVRRIVIDDTDDEDELPTKKTKKMEGYTHHNKVRSSGLIWVNIGRQEPIGMEIYNSDLAANLKESARIGKVEKSRWNSFEIYLQDDSFIKVGNNYFKPGIQTMDIYSILPGSWTKHFSQNENAYYYFNHNTNMSIWENSIWFQNTSRTGKKYWFNPGTSMSVWEEEVTRSDT